MIIAKSKCPCHWVMSQTNLVLLGNCAEGNGQQAVLLGSPADKKALVEVLQRFSKEGSTTCFKSDGWKDDEVVGFKDFLFGIGKDPI